MKYFELFHVANQFTKNSSFPMDASQAKKFFKLFHIPNRLAKRLIFAEKVV